MFNFAWVDASETVFDPDVHAREDERVYSYSFEQTEGDFASLKVTIVNPHVGLLSPGRKIWVWFSVLLGGVQTPLFFGRLVGIPSNIFQETVELDFVARPSDYPDQKAAVADSMRVLPFYDPLFVREESFDDPDAVLEGYSALWHVDPATHVVSASDLLVGEDGVVVFTADDYYADGMELTIGDAPARSVEITATLNWTQTGGGLLDLTGQLVNNWVNPGFKYPGLISSYTFLGLMDSWPQPGTDMSGGWRTSNTALYNVTSQHVPGVQPLSSSAFMASDIAPINIPEDSMILYGPPIVGTQQYYPSAIIYVPMGWGRPKLELSYHADREYTEHVSMRIDCDVQDVLTMPAEDETIRISMSSNSASDLYPPDYDEPPIGNVGSRSFADQDRGKMAILHMLCVARSSLIARARCVQISITTSFSRAVSCSLRKNAQIFHPRLPGGVVVGKIVGLSHALSGQDGALRAQVTVACAIGRGGSYSPAEGDPLYVEDGYVSDGYQARENVIEVLSTSDIAFSVNPYEPNDDGIDFTQPLTWRDVLITLGVENRPHQQKAAVMSESDIAMTTNLETGATGYDEGGVRTVINDHATKINLKLKPLTVGPFDTDVTVDVFDLVIPKQIDLEAAS